MKGKRAKSEGAKSKGAKSKRANSQPCLAVAAPLLLVGVAGDGGAGPLLARVREGVIVVPDLADIGDDNVVGPGTAAL